MIIYCDFQKPYLKRAKMFPIKDSDRTKRTSFYETRKKEEHFKKWSGQLFIGRVKVNRKKVDETNQHGR